MEQDYSLYGLGFFTLFVVGICFSVTRPAVKILEQTQSKLLFRIRPVLFWGIAVFFWGLGLLFLVSPFLIYTPVTTLTCNRSVPPLSFTTTEPAPSVCDLVKENWLGIEKNHIAISSLQRATLETEPARDAKTRLHYRVVLLTSEDKIPFVSHLDDFEYEEWQTRTAQINTFVKNPTAALRIQQDRRILGYASFGIGSFLALVGFFAVAAPPTITCTLAQESNSLTLKRQKYFGANTLTFKLSLDDILKVLLERSRDNGQVIERVTLKLTSGECFPLTYSYDSLGGKQQISTFIRSFLRTSKNKE